MDLETNNAPEPTALRIPTNVRSGVTPLRPADPQRPTMTMPPRVPLISLTVVAALLCSGCGSYPEGVTRAEWERMTPTQKARWTQDTLLAYPKEGQVLGQAISDDQRSRERGPELTNR